VCATIGLLHFVPMLSERQQEMPHVFGSGGEAVERALQRGVNGRERQRLRRELRVGARSRIIVQLWRASNARACMRMRMLLSSLTRSA